MILPATNFPSYRSNHHAELFVRPKYFGERAGIFMPGMCLAIKPQYETYLPVLR